MVAGIINWGSIANWISGLGALSAVLVAPTRVRPVTGSDLKGDGRSYKVKGEGGN